MDLDKDVSVKFAERTPHSPTTTQLRRGDATTATVRYRRTSEDRSPTPTATCREPGVAMDLSDPCCSLARGSHSLSHVHSPYQSLGHHSLNRDGRRAWKRKDSEKRIASNEVRRDYVSSKANNLLRRSAGVVRRRPRSHDKRSDVDRVKSDAEQDDSDCIHDSPVRRKSSDAFCSDSSSLSADSSSDTDAGEYDCTHNDRSDAVSRAPYSRRKHVLPTLTVCVEVGRVKSTIMLMM